ncbi:MAG: hypothetical protein ACYDEO_07015, partial [Aggregatilineales bacterium]
VATANKIARTVYYMLKYHVQFEDIGAEEFERKHRERDIVALRHKAAKLGFTLVEPAPAQPAVSIALLELPISHRIQYPIRTEVSQKIRGNRPGIEG